MKVSVHEFCNLYRLPIHTVNYNGEHIRCVQTASLKICLGLSIKNNEDLTDYTPLKDLKQKTESLRAKHIKEQSRWENTSNHLD